MMRGLERIYRTTGGVALVESVRLKNPMEPLRRSASPFLLVACTCACDANSATVPERVPAFVPLAAVPEARRYSAEFATLDSLEEDVAIALRPEPALPFERSLVEGRVFETDRNLPCATWVVQSYAGSSWVDSQKLYVFSESTADLQDITASLPKGVLDSAVMLESGDRAEPFVLLASTPRSRWWSPANSKLWTLQLSSRRLESVCAGHSPMPSPDRTRVAFWRSTNSGYHCLFLWTIRTGEILPVISMWESDPGSGTSWNCGWSGDSRAFGIHGYCGGFYRSPRNGQQLDLIYLVDEDKMVTAQ